VAEPLRYETPPPPRKKRPFWPEGWKAAELAFVFVVFFGGMLADDYLKALGWSLWVRALVFLVVIYVGFWLSGRWRPRRDL
jgi:hypothetical protein